MRTIYVTLLSLAASGMLAGCQTAIYPTPTSAYIEGVTVAKSAREGSAAIPAGVRESVLRRAAGLPRTGRPKCLRIDVKDFHVKNPLMALLVGDSNRMSGTMTVVDQATGKHDAQTTVAASSTFLINGIIGAAQAALQDPLEVERKLVDDFGLRLVERLYGQQALRGPARPAPLSAVPAAVPVSVPSDRGAGVTCA